MTSFKKDEAPSNRRKRFVQRPKDGIDTSKMKMKDLIYFNPKENKMKSKGENQAPAKHVNGMSTPMRNEEIIEDSTESSVAAAPQIMIGPDGNIILDRQSLVKMVTPKRKMDESEITEVKEDSSTTTYSSFRKSKYSAAWSAGETQRFYNALSTVGTDFSMINAIFPNRKRRELKNKFKREERMNGVLVEKALRETRTFDFSDFQNMDEDSTSVNGESKNEAKPVKKRKKKKHEDPEDSYVAPKKRKAVNNKDDDEPIEIIEESLPSPKETELPSGMVPAKEQANKDVLENLHNPFGGRSLLQSTEDGKSSGDEDEYDMETILGKPTRSGRQPKQREVFTIQDTLSQPRIVRPSTEEVSIIGTKGKTGKRKKKMKHKKLKKRHLENQIAHGLGTVGSVPLASPGVGNSPETSEPRVPPLHPEISLSESTPRSSLSTNSSVHLPPSVMDQRPAESPSFRTEHYLVTYPDGTKTLIQMPVPVENDKSFEFVLNVLPSPYREGSTLQLGIVPKEGNFSPHTPAQPFELGGGVNLSLLNPGQGIPISQIVTPGSTPGNVSSAVALSGPGRAGVSPLISVPGTSTSFSPGIVNSNQSSQHLRAPSSSSFKTPVARTTQLVQSGSSSSSPMSYDRGSIVTPSSGNTYSGNPADILNSGTTALPQESIFSKSSTRLTGIITPDLKLGNTFNQSASTGSSGQDRFPTNNVTQKENVVVSHSNSLSTFKSGFAQIADNMEREGSRPPSQILSTPTQSSPDGLLATQDAVASKEAQPLSFALSDSKLRNISIRMHNSPSQGVTDQRPLEERVAGNSQPVVVDNPVTNNSSIENSVTDVETVMGYVSGLVDPIPAGSEISDPIIAQHVDVSSSVQHEHEIQATENEAFVPV